MSTDIPLPSESPESKVSSSSTLVKGARKKVGSILESSRHKLPDNILDIDHHIYKALCRVCSIGVQDGAKNGIVRIILSALTPSIFFINDSVDKLRNMFHEALIMSQIGGNGVRFDRNGLSLDAIAEVFLDIRHEQLHFSSQSYREHDEKRAYIRDLYPRDAYANNAASMFFMEHPGLIPYAIYITKKLFPFGIGRSCFIGAGGNGVVIKNKDSNLAFKFYYDLQRKKNTALREGPSQVVFSRAISNMHKEGKYHQFTSPYMEVLSDNHVEMELIDGETLDTLFKRFLLEKNQVVTSAANLRETELDTRMRHAGLTIREYTITEMLTEMYGQSIADSFSYFLLELEEKGLTHRDIDSSIYSGMRTNVNPKNLMVKNSHSEEPQFVLIDYGNVTIENKGGHRYREDYNLISKNGYI